MDDPARAGRLHQGVRDAIRCIYETIVLEHEAEVIAAAAMTPAERAALERGLQVEFERRVVAWRAGLLDMP